MHTSGPQNRSDLAALNERKTEITYQMHNLTMTIHSAASDQAPSARWILNGALRISTRERAGA